VPEGIVFVDIDAQNGKLATPNCPKVIPESFIAGTEPKEFCELHR
jgi:membrane carboxypeptidase/penicillin-binding protein